MDDVTLTHPLVDAVGPGFLVSETDAAVVELSAARTGLVLDTRAADRAFVLLTPSTSRITTAMLAMLRRTGSAWIVREGDRYRAAGSTTIADDVASAMLSEQATPRSTRLGPDEVPWTEVVASVHHPATEQAGIGRTAELLLDGLATTAPAGWGTVEPATVGWSVSAVTDLARRRAPRLTRLVATAPVEGGVAAVQIRVERSATGVMEETRLALPMPGGAARPTETGPAPAGGRVVTVLEDLARRQRVLLATAWRTAGHPDATLAARQIGMPVPLGAVVGAAAVRDLGVDPSALPTGATAVGPRRVPSLVLGFAPGSPGLRGGAEVEARWRRLAEVGTALGPRVVELLRGGGRA